MFIYVYFLCWHAVEILVLHLTRVRPHSDHDRSAPRRLLDRGDAADPERFDVCFKCSNHVQSNLRQSNIIKYDK